MAENVPRGDMTDSILPAHVSLGVLGQTEMGDKRLSEETGDSILGNFLQMEGTAAELKEEESSIMEALAECEEALEEADEDYEEEDDDEEDDDDSDDDEEDDEDDDDVEEKDEESDNGEEDGSKTVDEALDFGEMPDFSSMMEAEGTSILEGAVASDLGLKALQEADLMDIGVTESKPDKGTSDKDSDGKKHTRKRKRKTQGNDNDKKPTKKTKKTKKKKKKKAAEDSNVDSKSLKASERRRNIRKIIGEQELEKETLDAQQEELERQQRLMELKRHAMSNMASSNKAAAASSASATNTSTTTAAKEQDSQLKSLLQSAEAEAQKIEKKEIDKKKAELEKKNVDMIPLADIKKEVEIKEEKPPKEDVIELSSDSDDPSEDDDCVMIQSSEEEEREMEEVPEDLNDGGAHINDEFNCKDDEGRVLVNVGHPSEDPDIFLAPQMARAIKPHQIGGVRFLYDNLVESLPRFNTSQGFGCILAHSMGLGKTIQVISFIDIFFHHTSAKKVLCIVPINTLQNWMAEFNMWAPSDEPIEPTPVKETAKKTEKKPRERGKKAKEANKGPRGGGKGSKGKGPAGQMGQDTATMDPLAMGDGQRQGANMLNMQGMGPVGNMGPGSMGSMGGPGMMPMGSSMNQMGAPGMDFTTRNCNAGVMGAPGQLQNNYMGAGGNMCMQGATVSQMGSCGGSFQETPWMNTMGQSLNSPYVANQSMSSDQSSANSAPFSSTDPRLFMNNPKSFSPYGTPVTSVGGSPNSNLLGTSGQVADNSNPYSANAMGGMMEADGWNRTGNLQMGWQGSPLNNPCNAVGSSMNTTSSGMLSTSSQPNPLYNMNMGPGLGSQNSVESGHMTNNCQSMPDVDGLERFMGSNVGGAVGNMGNGNGFGRGSPFPSAPNIGDMNMTFPPVNSNAQPSSLSHVNSGVSMPFGTSNLDMSSLSKPSDADSNSASQSLMFAGNDQDPKLTESLIHNNPSSNNGAGMDGRATEGDAQSSVKEEKPETETDAGTKSTAGKVDGEGIKKEGEVRHRNFKIFLLNDSCKATDQRARIIADWNEAGGVLLMGYEMYRLLSNRRSYTIQPKKRSRAKNSKQKLDVIDVDEEDKNKNLLIDIYGALVNPGPELVVCDEGHRIKNNHASTSQALKQIRTRRRVVLTGYPLQNNLMEYWCMVDFVRPNFLGNKTEFSNMFERPIMNGQCQDSTIEDRKLMKQRAYVLHNLLSGFVQRRSHAVLQRALPCKQEYVFLVRMSPVQRKLYRRYIDSLEESASLLQASTNPLKAFSVGCKIWNHPDILYKSIVLKKSVVEDNDLDIEGGEGSGSKRKPMKKTESSSSLASMSSIASSASNATLKSSASSLGLSSLCLDVPSPYSSGTGTLTPDAANSTASQEYDADLNNSVDSGVGTAVPGVTTGLETKPDMPMMDKKEDDHAWVGDAFENYEEGELDHGPKMVLLMTIFEESLRIDNKILVFSQSLSTLDTIEEFLSKQKVPRPDMDENWAKNRSYFRLDGSTSAQERERLITEFNRPNNKTTWVFLLSTKAGCLGINLIGANRAVVLDASWNPCHDCQAVCRVFRFGQKKECFIYRLVTENTLERNIYDRQITKQGMSDRIVDEVNIENPFSRKQLQNLLKNEDKDFPYIDFGCCEDQYDDPVLIKTLKKQGQWITKEPFTHESLLIDRKELRMTLKEKRLAKEGYARDKRMNVTYSRPSYAAYYPGGSGSTPMYVRRTPQPHSSIRPMISTPPSRQGPQFIKPGVSVQQVITTTDIVLPGTNTATNSGSGDSSNKIAAGQKILVIKTPKGVYIRTNDGKMFAVRSKSGDDDDDASDAVSSTVAGMGSTSTTTSSTASSSGSGGIMSTSSHPNFYFKSPGSNRMMDGKTFSMPGSSRLARNMYPINAQFNPALRGRGMSPMMRPSFSASSRARSRVRVGDKSGMGDLMLPLPDALPPRRAGRSRGMGLFRMGGPPMSPYTSSSNMADMYRKQFMSSRPPRSQQSGLNKDSPMMKLLTSDEDGEKVARSFSLSSGLSDLSSRLDSDSLFSQDRNQTHPGQKDGDTEGKRDQYSSRDDDNSKDLDSSGDKDPERDLDSSRDLNNSSAASSPLSDPGDIMDRYLSMAHRDKSQLPAGLDMGDMDEFSQSSSDSSMSHQMAPQHSSHSPVPPRHSSNTDAPPFTGDGKQFTNQPNFPSFLRDQELFSGQTLPLSRRDISPSSQLRQSMVHSPQLTQSMVRSPLPHSPLSQQSHSPLPSFGRQTQASVSQSVKLSRNTHPMSSEESADSPMSDPSLSNQSLPPFATRSIPSFDGVPPLSSRQSHFLQKTPADQASAHLKSSSPSPRPPEMWGQASPSSHQQYSSRPPQESQHQGMGMAETRGEDSNSDEDDSDASDEWMNSPGWLEGKPGQVQNQLDGEGEGHPTSSGHPSLSGQREEFDEMCLPDLDCPQQQPSFDHHSKPQTDSCSKMRPSVGNFQWRRAGLLRDPYPRSYLLPERSPPGSVPSFPGKTARDLMPAPSPSFACPQLKSSVREGVGKGAERFGGSTGKGQGVGDYGQGIRRGNHSSQQSHRDVMGQAGNARTTSGALGTGPSMFVNNKGENRTARSDTQVFQTGANVQITQKSLTQPSSFGANGNLKFTSSMPLPRNSAASAHSSDYQSKSGFRPTVFPEHSKFKSRSMKSQNQSYRPRSFGRLSTDHCQFRSGPVDRKLPESQYLSGPVSMNPLGTSHRSGSVDRHSPHHFQPVPEASKSSEQSQYKSGPLDRNFLGPIHRDDPRSKNFPDNLRSVYVPSVRKSSDQF